MTDTFLDAETAGGNPRELFTIVRSDGVTYRHTSASRDIVYEGSTYTAIAIDRGAIEVSKPDDQGGDIEVSLPVNHDLVRRWLQQATPPKRVTVTIQRMFGSVVETIWTGTATGITAADSVAKLRLAPTAGEWALRVIPLRTVNRKCPYALYDSLCRVDRDGANAGLAFKVETTLIAVTGRTVKLDLGSTDRNGTWAVFGEVVHSNGERMSVLSQTDLASGSTGVCNLELEGVLVGARVGDVVTVYAGCNWTLSQCRDRFNNLANFGGLPYLETEPPTLIGLFGLRKGV